MYREHPQFKIVRTEGLPLWRYMDLWKFLKLISTSSLFFPNFKLLGDQNEGRMPLQVFEFMREHDLKNGRDDNFVQVYRDFMDAHARDKGLILSWNACLNESFALWKMYAKDKLGIAIKTNHERLKQCFKNCNEDIYIGEVNYFDSLGGTYEFKEFSNYLTKNIYYEFESEVRCITKLAKGDNATHKNIIVDLNILIEEIFISPFAEETGLIDVIDFLKKKNNLEFNIRISAINDNWL